MFVANKKTRSSLKLAYLIYVLSTLTGCLNTQTVSHVKKYTNSAQINIDTTSTTPPTSTIENKSASENRKLSDIFADEELAHQASSLLTKDKQLYQKTHIRVFALNQTLILIGEAPTQKLKDLAEASIQSLKNIKEIKNLIAITSLPSTTTRSLDSWATTKLKTLLLAEKNLHSTNIKVVTENNVIYLLGLVPKTEAIQAVKIAEQVSKNYNVVSLFEITPLNSAPQTNLNLTEKKWTPK